jgi:hypothetical protein
MSSVAERREMKPRTDCVGVSQYALGEKKLKWMRQAG